MSESTDKHKTPLTGIRFNPEIKKAAKLTAKKYGLSFNEFVNRAVDRVNKEMSKKEPVL